MTLPPGDVMLTTKLEQIQPLVLGDMGGRRFLQLAKGDRIVVWHAGDWPQFQQQRPYNGTVKGSAEQVINLDRENERATEMLHKGIKDL